LHVLDELRSLEQKYSDSLVIVGVHSPKFPHEATPEAVMAAVERYSVEHPVLDDPDLETWQQYAVRAWPTLVLIDPEGYIVAQHSGEGHAHALDALLEQMIGDYQSRGTLHPSAGVYVAPTSSDSTLRFPAKAVLLPNRNLLVADAGHHSLAEIELDSDRLVRRIGSGERGFRSGASGTAQFNEPNGLCLLPPEVRDAAGYDVVVADTVNHALRGVRLRDGRVRNLAGTGQQWMQGDPLPDHAFADTPMSSPWDVSWVPAWSEVAIAMAGNHQLWSYDPVGGRLTARAGTTQEGLVDGDLPQAWFAQPSGLATAQDGSTLWFVDAETSALRRVTNGVVYTEVGTGLFDFGHMDGPAAEAMLQHPLDCCVLADGSIAIADTYNGSVRRFDPDRRVVSTLVGDLAEPSGVVPFGPELIVIESSAHRVSRIRLPEEATVVRAPDMQSQRPSLALRPGTVALEVQFLPPPGQKLDDRYGPSVHVAVSATPPELLEEGEGSGEALRRLVRLGDDVTSGVLHVSARVASCDAADAEFPACHIHQQDWGVPIEVSADGTAEVMLPLAAR
ncbi:MAG: NHL domain-containing thioredoxin family protein, partial [Actinomycetes bacterium]